MKKFGFALIWSFLVMISTLPGFAHAALAGGLGWEIVAGANLCGEKGKDILWKNVATGEAVVRHMGGNSLICERKISIKSSRVVWSVVGVGDSNRDGHPDMLPRDLITGRLIVGYRRGNFLLDTTSLERFPPLSKVVWVKYFNHAGWPYILWKNSNTGQIVVWYMSEPLKEEVVFPFAARAPPSVKEFASLNRYVYACPGINCRHIVQLRVSRPLPPAEELCGGVLFTGLYTRDSPPLPL